MTWFSLSSTALKYKITLKKSVIQPFVIFMQEVVLLIVILYCFNSISYTVNLYSLHNITFYTLAVLAIFFFFSKAIYHCFYHPYKRRSNNALFSENSVFTIDQIGVCQFSVEEKRQLSAQSKISWLGVYLFFEDNDASANHTIKKNERGYFLYKDMFSLQDYSRISRIILYCQNSSSLDE